MSKTVYILGAGFSIEAGAPSQENLIKTIFELSENSETTFHKKSIDEFSTFLTDVLLIPPVSCPSNPRTEWAEV